MTEPGRIRVLVAEGDENLAQLLTTFLRGRGFHAVRLEPHPIDEAPALLTRHAGMQAALATIDRLAPTDTPVLLVGENGSGRSMLARALHRRSRRSGPVIECDAGRVADSVLEVTLFGRERGLGAGTAGTAQKSGLIELGADGTLFIDRVGALGARLQARLLRTLEHGTFMRVAGRQRIEVATRLVTATTEDLEATVRANRFRADLFYRLNTVTVDVPPLRERTDDVPLLADHFLRQFAGPDAPGINPDALAALQEYAWPGNIRELRNVVERAAMLANGREIGTADLPFTDGAPSVAARPMALADLERQHIAAVLAREQWHQGNAARALGISPKTLYRKIREYGFRRPRAR